MPIKTNNSTSRCNFCQGVVKRLLFVKKLPVFVGVSNDRPQKEDCLAISMGICKNCGLIQQISSKALEKKLKKIYLSKKAVLSTPLGEGSWGQKRLDNFLKDAKIQYFPEEVLDIGCGTGGLLLELFKRGCKKISGFEPSILAEKIKKPAEGFLPEIYNDFFSLRALKKNKLEGKYGLIIATAVLEHIKNLKDFLRALRLALKEDGVVVFTVPNELFALKKGDPGMILHEHLNYFTPKTLQRILSLAGFKILNTKTKKDVLIIKLKKKIEFSGRFNKTPSKIVGKEEALFKNYKKNLAKAIKKFVNFTKKGKIGLYGASAASFNLMGWSKSKEFKSLFFIDSDPIKWNKKLFGIPIIPPKDILNYQSNTILVMPPAFQEEIFKYLKSLNLPRQIKIIKFWKK